MSFNTSLMDGVDGVGEEDDGDDFASGKESECGS